MAYQSEKTGAKVDELLDKIDALETATTSTAGLMSAEDKTALDSISEKFVEGIAKTDLDSGVQTSLDKADTALQSFTETDPTVPSWAKASSKPSYTAAEVGAVPTTRTVNGKALSSDITLSASDVSALPSSTVIPSAPGTLNTDNSTAQTVSSSEALSGTVKLHKVSKTGSYNDLLNKPTIPTVPTDVSAFINDAGYLTSHQDISGKEDSSNKVTSLSSSSTDTQYPSAKCVYDIIGDIETLLAAL